MVSIMEQTNTDVNVENNSLVSVSKGSTGGGSSSFSSDNPSIRKFSGTSRSKPSNVSPLQLFDQKLNIGVRSKSMSESLPISPKKLDKGSMLI